MYSEKRTVFRCDYCKKPYLVAPSCLHHELICRKNPINNHDCFCCEHLIQSIVNVDSPYQYNDESEESLKIKTFYCEHLGKYLYSNKALVNKHWVTNTECWDINDGSREINHELMPLTCEHKKNRRIT